MLEYSKQNLFYIEGNILIIRFVDDMPSIYDMLIIQAHLLSFKTYLHSMFSRFDLPMYVVDSVVNIN